MITSWGRPFTSAIRRPVFGSAAMMNVVAAVAVAIFALEVTRYLAGQSAFWALGLFLLLFAGLWLARLLRK
jgi:hypothetical protein